MFTLQDIIEFDHFNLFIFFTNHDRKWTYLFVFVVCSGAHCEHCHRTRKN